MSDFDLKRRAALAAAGVWEGTLGLSERLYRIPDQLNRPLKAVYAPIKQWVPASAPVLDVMDLDGVTQGITVGQTHLRGTNERAAEIDAYLTGLRQQEGAFRDLQATADALPKRLESGDWAALTEPDFVIGTVSQLLPTVAVGALGSAPAIGYAKLQLLDGVTPDEP